VKWDEHFEQELLVFGFQRQSKTIDDTKHTHTHTHTVILAYKSQNLRQNLDLKVRGRLTRRS